MNIKNLLLEDLTIPTPEEICKFKKEQYDEKLKSPNNFSYWYPKIKDCGILVPESIIMPISFYWYVWLESDDYQPDKVQEFNEIILKFLKENNFNTNRKLFIKNNSFSNKFVFNTCCVEDIEDIGLKFINVNYGSLIVGAGNGTELVVREFIENSEKIPTIYEGMPLNVEFRIFYDFDTNTFIDIFNYWDKDTMENSLHDTLDRQTYSSYSETLEKQFEETKGLIEELAVKHLKDIDLKGIWSVDFMYVNNKVYLIDMATAETSYYFDRISDYVNEKK